MTTPPLQMLPLIYDLEQALATLRSAATNYTVDRSYLPRGLMIAAVAFTVQLAIESGHAPDPLRALERELITHIDAAEKGPLALGNVTTPSDNPVNTSTSDEDHDWIIDLRDKLLAKGDIGTLSVLDQNLLRDCDIALGLVRCRPETREEARIRILRVLRSLEAMAST